MRLEQNQHTYWTVIINQNMNTHIYSDSYFGSGVQILCSLVVI